MSAAAPAAPQPAASQPAASQPAAPQAAASPPPPPALVAPGDIAALLLDESTGVPPLDNSRRIFVNRNLRLDKIEVVGFDMDYTLAIYKKVAIEQLAFDCTVEKLIALGYPEGIREVRYERDRVIRGLVVDKRNGRIFKCDRYGHVTRVWHGLREVGKEERQNLYRQQRLEIDGPDYERVDTLFSLPEAGLYAALVDWFDKAPADVPRRTYLELAVDVRKCVDLAHADGSIKSVIQVRPQDFVEKSPELAVALHRFRSAGKRLFVLTNSMWPYTRVLMSFLLDGVLEGYPTWRSYFDLVIVGSRKPAFFRTPPPGEVVPAAGGKYGGPFRRVDEATGEPVDGPVASLDKSKVYQGGNLADLERLAGFAGESVLYVGDHIYGDILLSKKQSLWRTCMVVPELEDVVWHEELYGPDLQRYAALDDEIQRADYAINYYKLLLNRIERAEQAGRLDDAELGSLREASRRSRQALEALRLQVRALVKDRANAEAHIDKGHNPYWGRLFVEGTETSLFGQQIENWACVYTSRVANFAFYSPLQYFRSPPEQLPHERHL